MVRCAIYDWLNSIGFTQSYRADTPNVNSNRKQKQLHWKKKSNNDNHPADNLTLSGIAFLSQDRMHQTTRKHKLSDQHFPEIRQCPHRKWELLPELQQANPTASSTIPALAPLHTDHECISAVSLHLSSKLGGSNPTDPPPSPNISSERVRNTAFLTSDEIVAPIQRHTIRKIQSYSGIRRPDSR